MSKETLVQRRRVVVTVRTRRGDHRYIASIVRGQNLTSDYERQQVMRRIDRAFAYSVFRADKQSHRTTYSCSLTNRGKPVCIHLAYQGIGKSLLPSQQGIK